VLWLAAPGQGATGKELALPTGTVELVVGLQSDRISLFESSDLERPVTMSGPVVCGVHTRPFAIEDQGSNSVLGIHFRPGGAASLLGLPLSELENIHVPLSTVLGDVGERLQEACALAPVGRELQAAARCLSAAIHGATDPLVSHAVQSISRWEPDADVASLVEASGYSHRRFNERFRDTVGVSPKRFIRLMRFQRVIELLGDEVEADWSDVAAHCGYYDQAHLIHDFRSFSGMTPAAYLDRRSGRLNHATA